MLQVLDCVYERLLPLVDGFNSLVQLHLLLLGTQVLVRHPVAVVRIIAHLHGQLANIRLKVGREGGREGDHGHLHGQLANIRLKVGREGGRGSLHTCMGNWPILRLKVGGEDRGREVELGWGCVIYQMPFPSKTENTTVYRYQVLILNASTRTLAIPGWTRPGTINPQSPDMSV